MNARRVPLRRRGPGDYWTGSFEVVKDPTPWGYVSWLVYVRPYDTAAGEPVAMTGSLREARQWLAGEDRAAARTFFG